PQRRLRDILLVSRPPLLREERSVVAEKLCQKNKKTRRYNSYSKLRTQNPVSCFFPKIFSAHSAFFAAHHGGREFTAETQRTRSVFWNRLWCFVRFRKDFAFSASLR